jgi:hypothetical protein
MTWENIEARLLEHRGMIHKSYAKLLVKICRKRRRVAGR